MRSLLISLSCRISATGPGVIGACGDRQHEAIEAYWHARGKTSAAGGCRILQTERANGRRGSPTKSGNYRLRKRTFACLMTGCTKGDLVTGLSSDFAHQRQSRTTSLRLPTAMDPRSPSRIPALPRARAAQINGSFLCAEDCENRTSRHPRC